MTPKRIHFITWKCDTECSTQNSVLVQYSTLKAQKSIKLYKKNRQIMNWERQAGFTISHKQDDGTV
jgi:hypothetical protein